MTLINQAQDFVCNLLKDKLSSLYTYHNLQHTLGVVNAVTILCDSENLDSSERELLLLAAWFHDLGYINGYTNHEDSGCAIVCDFLKEKGKSEQDIAKVTRLIQATAMEYVPQTLFEKIIKDADYYHLFEENYLETCQILREEWQNTEDKSFSDKDWAIENLDFLMHKHHFYTDFALLHWQPLKEKNIKKMEDLVAATTHKTNKKLKKYKIKNPKEEKPERGIDTLFRITLGNHTRLSGIADSKANILLSVNAIIISVALSTIIPKLGSPKNVHLIIPTFIMVISSVVTIIFAILSTRPKVTKGVFTRKDIEDKKVNLLFFGNFYKMPLHEYEWAMNEMMKDREYLYNSMVKDLYFLGIVLERKYRLLRIAYNIFMIGIVISVFTFVNAFYQ